jgi:hypothetical protein
VIVGDARERASLFIEFCDGVEEAGLVEYGRRGRVLARDLLEALDERDAARSMYAAQDERIARQERLLARSVGPTHGFEGSAP